MTGILQLTAFVKFNSIASINEPNNTSTTKGTTYFGLNRDCSGKIRQDTELRGKVTKTRDVDTPDTASTNCQTP
jgi:hypothetical protein